jgi:hypothetical protein
MLRVEARRYLPFNDKPSDRVKRVVEPELDMHRVRPEDSSWARYLRDIVHWLFPTAATAANARRSVARALEEDWPTAER